MVLKNWSQDQTQGFIENPKKKKEIGHNWQF
jgi:hypothetical protein